MSVRSIFILSVFCVCIIGFRSFTSAQVSAGIGVFSAIESQRSVSPGAVRGESEAALSQDAAMNATIRGVVSVGPSAIVARNAVVTIAELKKSVLTDEN